MTRRLVAQGRVQKRQHSPGANVALWPELLAAAQERAQEKNCSLISYDRFPTKVIAIQSTTIVPQGEE